MERLARECVEAQCDNFISRLREWFGVKIQQSQEIGESPIKCFSRHFFEEHPEIPSGFFLPGEPAWAYELFTSKEVGQNNGFLHFDSTYRFSLPLGEFPDQ